MIAQINRSHLGAVPETVRPLLFWSDCQMDVACLDWREQTTIYRAAPTLQGTPMTDLFFTNPQQVNANEVTMYSLATSNSPLNANTRGAAPRRVSGIGASKKSFGLFHSFNELAIEDQALTFLDSKDPDVVQIGTDILEGNLNDFGRRQRLFREVAIGQIMTYGRVHINSDGAVELPTVNATSGAITAYTGAVQADFGVDDSHRGRCPIGGGSYIFSGAWGTASTDIFAELTTLKDQAAKSGAEMPNTIYLHGTRRVDLVNNTIFKAWATLNNVRNDQVLNGGGVDNVWGWNFRFLDGYWTDASGTQRPVIPVRNGIIVPADGPWKRCFEGIQRIPTQLGITTDIKAAMAKTAKVHGMFAFAQLKVSPMIQLLQYMGDNFGMGFANANAVWMPTLFAS